MWRIIQYSLAVDFVYEINQTLGGLGDIHVRPRNCLFIEAQKCHFPHFSGSSTLSILYLHSVFNLQCMLFRCQP